jgi:hypothetical protein
MGKINEHIKNGTFFKENDIWDIFIQVNIINSVRNCNKYCY